MRQLPRRTVARLGSLLCCCLLVQVGARAEADGYRHPYEFGADWFSSLIPRWEKHLGHLRGRPQLSYLEIGPYEGRSFFWVVDQLLTHPSSRATAIDIFESGTSQDYADGYEARFRANVALSGAQDRITVIKGRSQLELRKLPLASFDLIYVDGSHSPPDVLADLVLSWALLRDGGYLVADDYGFRAEWPEPLRPMSAIHSFIDAYQRQIEVVARYYQIVLRKRADGCLAVHYEGCSILGPYYYDWRDRRLLRADTLEEMSISSEERRWIEMLIRAQRSGTVQPRPGPRILNDPTFQALNQRLDLGY